MKSILFVTAFYDIGREKWNYKNKEYKYQRDNEDYHQSFIQLANNLKYDLHVYLEKKDIPKLKLKVSKKNIIFFDIDNIKDQLFVSKYYNLESQIIKSDNYQKKLSRETKFKPEHLYSLYNLINHDKVNFVYQSYLQNKNYDYYSWIDYGFSKFKMKTQNKLIPRDINFNLLSDNKIIYQSLEYNIPKKSPIIMLSTNKVYIAGTFWICPKRLVGHYQKIYHQELKRFHNLKIVDDDQNLVLQLVLKHTNLFKLYYLKNFMVLWLFLLNKPDQDSKRNKAIVARVGSSATKKTLKKSYSKKKIKNLE